MSIQTGVYTIANVRSRNLVAIADANDATWLISSSGNDPRLSHKWLVSRCKNQRYTIRSSLHRTFARCHSRPQEGSEIYGTDAVHYWDIQRTRNRNELLIRSTDGGLYWRAPDDEHRTPLVLSNSATDSRNHWVLSLQPSEIETLEPLWEPSSYMRPILEVLLGIYRERDQVEVNRHQCNHLVRRARKMFDAISDEVQTRDVEEFSGPTLDRVVRNFKLVKECMSYCASLNLLASLLRGLEISKLIEDAHKHLADCVCFQIQFSSYSKGFAKARAADTEHLESMFAGMKGDDNAVLRLLNLQSYEISEAVVAIRNFLDHHPEDSPEKRILTVAMSSFSRKSKQIGQGLPPGWTRQISTFEVDVYHDMDLSPSGSGAGVVKKGLWNGRVVAVKQMSPDTSSQALLNQTLVWRELRHNHVVPIYGASVTVSPPFIVSKYMTNGNILQYLQFFPVANRLALIHGVALGMIYLHHNNIIHGNIKGANILIDESGRACIADFGLNLVQAPSRSQSVAYPTKSLRFMAPEYMRGTLIKPSDVYSFAMMMFELFTGSPPFSFIPEDKLFIMVGQQFTRLVRPSSPEILARGLNDRVWGLIWSCSIPQPEVRPAFTGVEPILRLQAKNWGGSRPSQRHVGPIPPEIMMLCDLIFDTLPHLPQAVYNHPIQPFEPSPSSATKDAMSVLKKLFKVVARRRKGKRTVLSRNALSSQYSRLFPQLGGQNITSGAKPKAVKTMRDIREEIELIKSFDYMKIARDLRRSPMSRLGVSTTADQLSALQLKTLQVVKKNSLEYQMIQAYAEDTIDPKTIFVKIESIFRVERFGEEERWNAAGWQMRCRNGDRRLLWHGSRMCNYVGILKQGLKIAPEEARHTGTEFGKGLYFADMFHLSAKYTHPHASNNIGLLLLCEVVAAPYYQTSVTNPNAEADAVRQGKVATLALGRMQHTMWKDAGESLGRRELRGVAMPSGRAVEMAGLFPKKCGDMWSEYVVYDISQVKIRYLVECMVLIKRK